MVIVWSSTTKLIKQKQTENNLYLALTLPPPTKKKECINFGHSQRNKWETRCHLLVGLLSMLTGLSSDEAHLEYAVYSEGQWQSLLFSLHKCKFGDISHSGQLFGKGSWSDASLLRHTGEEGRWGRWSVSANGRNKKQISVCSLMMLFSLSQWYHPLVIMTLAVFKEFIYFLCIR